MSLIGLNYWASTLAETGELETIEFVRSRLDGTRVPVIFDVGANVGEFTLACLATFRSHCQVHAFEPSAATFAMLERAVAGKGNVTLHKFGFSDEERELILYSSEPGSTIASVHKLDRPIRPFRDEYAERVTLATIDQFCTREGIDRIDFLKLDIEGHEMMALSGARKLIAESNIRFIQFEFGENNVSSRTYLSDFQKLLGDRFRFYQIVPGGPVPWDYEGGRSEIFATMNYLCERVD